MRWQRAVLLRQERGQALVLAALMILVMFALAALAIDLGMLVGARNESQRTSDASALAGASAFFDYENDDPTSVHQATQRAKEYAAKNYIRGRMVDTATAPPYIVNDSAGPIHVSVGEGITVAVRPLERRVTVWTRRMDLPMWFARFAGATFLGVKTAATAEVTEGGTTNACVLPFTIVDLWDDLDDDANRNRLVDDTEQWLFEDGGELATDQTPDRYHTYDRSGVSDASYGDDFNGTGYGSGYRDVQSDALGYTYSADYGRRIILKADSKEGGAKTGAGSGWDGESTGQIGPGNFQIWNMPDPLAGCQQDRDGADFVRENISQCNPCRVSLGENYPAKPGNVTSVKSALADVFVQDPSATWVNDANHRKGGYIANSKFPNPEQNSPLVRTVGIIPPTVNLQGRENPVHFVQFAKVFIEPENPDGAVYVRFMGPIMGGSGGPTTGSLVRSLRLVR